ncbi:protein misato 1-like [Histomonas meleagridis]|uniref:protein misato-like 1-like n=1 Tax=Histomonas meleagridis TaxID=135588 RepID=UPI00355A3CD6|nr:protein misato 1-like [Histomonas meleagridis]KAH0804580.1 protein misato-like 1-like [Histomonas meleagridis]
MSTIFLSFGPTSGLLTGHCINSLVECVDMPPTWYGESSQGLLPNAVFFTNARTVHLFQDYDDKEEINGKVEKFDPPPDSPVQVPKFKPTPFIQYIKGGGQTFLPLDKPRPDLGLSNAEIGWSDIVNFNLSRRSFFEIPGTDIEPLKSYCSGIEIASDSNIYDELTEPIRYSLERCDRVSDFVITIDRNTGYGGIFNQISEYLIEEAPKATKISFSIAEDITSEEVACNASLSLASALNYTNMHTVLTLPEKLPNIIDPARFKPTNLYEMTALLSIPFTSALIPILTNAVTLRTVVDTVAPSSILKFTSLSSAFPYYDPVIDFSFKTEERIYSRYTLVSGVPQDDSTKIIENQMKPGAPYFYSGVSQKYPYFVGLTMPLFFKDRVVTNTGGKPSTRPAGLSEADYQRLVQFKVIKEIPAVTCPYIRTMSTLSAFSTSRSLVDPLKNTVDFIRRAPYITKKMYSDDASAAAEIILNIIDGLNSPDE